MSPAQILRQRTDFCGLYHKNKSNRHRENVSVPQFALRLLLLFLVVFFLFPSRSFPSHSDPDKFIGGFLCHGIRLFLRQLACANERFTRLMWTTKTQKRREGGGGGGEREGGIWKKSFWHLTALQYIMHSGIHASAWRLLAKSNFLRPR